ncbi:YpiF family protein [Mechercharimyces sp. CAU 1602]|uniref:YpiF family protein n=1 Tax=Mechercharimyces sp. CAU 1602 TaxID=2973933 RepID=UPI002161EFEB|nr:YpiF family protein [Mechercharimyces sp. CAU 1602]MCS1351000.1 YpiF family protein [Mechercharimyces sp. CAU 1602]
MKLANVNNEEWNTFAPYVDTILLPVARLGFHEKELHSSEQVIEEIAGEVEQELQGRLLLMPTISYGKDLSTLQLYIRSIVEEWKSSSFYHIVILAAETVLHELSFSTVDKPYQITLIPVKITDGAKDMNIEEEASSVCEKLILTWSNE